MAVTNTCRFDREHRLEACLVGGWIVFDGDEEPAAVFRQERLGYDVRRPEWRRALTEFRRVGERRSHSDPDGRTRSRRCKLSLK